MHAEQRGYSWKIIIIELWLCSEVLGAMRGGYQEELRKSGLLLHRHPRRRYDFGYRCSSFSLYHYYLYCYCSLSSLCVSLPLPFSGNGSLPSCPFVDSCCHYPFVYRSPSGLNISLRRRTTFTPAHYLPPVRFMTILFSRKTVNYLLTI